MLIASLANRSTTDSITLDAVTGVDGVAIADVEPIELTKLGYASLVDEEYAPIEVTGDFEAGNYVTVSFSFSNGEDIELEVPVRRNCGDYAEIDGVEAGPKLCPSGNDLAESH